MPRVSPDHLAARREQILTAAMRLFAADGFHAVSMRRIVVASGMSAGAVYHYFPSKDSLLQATGQALAEAYRATVADLLERPEPPTPGEVLTALTRGMRAIHGREVDFTRLGILVWAEALRDPQVMAPTVRIQTDLRGRLTALARRWQEAGLVDPDADADAVASALYGLVPGYTLQLNTIGAPDPEDYAAGALALGRTPRSRPGTDPTADGEPTPR